MYNVLINTNSKSNGNHKSKFKHIVPIKNPYHHNIGLKNNVFKTISINGIVNKLPTLLMYNTVETQVTQTSIT